MVKGDTWEDHYARRARREKWLARSVYKLEEIDRKFKFIHTGGRLLDLGCYPGSWSQYGVKKVGPGGDVVGVDLKEPDDLSAPNLRFIKADVFALEIEWLTTEIGPMDVVLSDMAPRTSGIRVTDTSHSLELARKALSIAVAVLKQKGNFLVKVFEGEGLKTFRADLSQHFATVRSIRPSAVRKGSREIYLLGLRLVR